MFSQVVWLPGTRHDMVEGQMVVVAAVLAGEFVAEEEIEAREGSGACGLHIILEHDHRGYSEIEF